MYQRLLTIGLATSLCAVGLTAVTAVSAQAATPPAPYTTPGTSSYTIPAGVSVIKVVANGGGGGALQYSSDGGYTASGGSGAKVTTYVSVAAGDSISIGVGGGGAKGFGGGGGSSSYVTGSSIGPNDDDLLIVAGGGGGAGRNGGGAGGRSGSNGANADTDGSAPTGGRGANLNGNGGAGGSSGAVNGAAGQAWAGGGVGGAAAADTGSGAGGGGKAGSGGSAGSSSSYTGGGGAGYGGGGGGAALTAGDLPKGGAGGGGSSTAGPVASGFSTAYGDAGNFGWGGSQSNFFCTDWRPAECPPIEDRTQNSNTYWYWGLPGGNGSVTISFEVQDAVNDSAAVIGTDPVYTGVAATITTASTWTPASPTITRQWAACDDQDGRNCIAIPGATSATFTPTGLEMGRYLQLTETVVNSTGPLEVPTNIIGPVYGWTTVPSIAGESMVGSVLTATPGTSTFPGSEIPTGQWQVSNGTTWDDISGETGLQLTTTDAMVGFPVRYVELVTVGSTDLTQPSNEIDVTGATNLEVPVIGGAAEQMFGTELTVAPGVWGPDSGSFAPVVTRNWQVYEGSAWQDITGETELTFTPDSTYVGKSIRVLETGTPSVGDPITQASNEIAIVGPIPTTPASIAGQRVVGATLTATPGDYSNITDLGLEITPSWEYFNGTTWIEIVGETGTTLVIPAAAIEANIRYLEVASLGGVDQSNPSNEIGPIGGPELITVPVAAQDGGVVAVPTAAVFGVTEGVTGVDVPQTGRWQVDTDAGWVDLGITTPNLPITAGLRDKSVRWLATGSLGGVDVDGASNTVGPLVVPEPTTAPVIVGDPKVDAVLTATPGAWAPDETVVTGRWQINENGTWTDVEGATSLTLTVTSAMAGGTLRYVETGVVDGVEIESPSNEIGPIESLATPKPIKVNVQGRPNANKFKVNWKQPPGSQAPITYRVTLRQKGFKKIIIRKGVTPPKTSVTLSRKQLLRVSQRPRGDMAGLVLRYRVMVEAIYPNGNSPLAKSAFDMRVK